MPRQKGDSRIRLVVIVVVVVVMVVVVVVVVSASAATTVPQRKKKGGGNFSTGVLSLHEGVILLQLEGVLFIRSGVIFLRRIMTRVIPLRSKMTRGGHFVRGVISLRYTGPLIQLFNYSLHCCKMPSAWKLFNVCLLFKGGDPSIPSNYRPVSLLNIIEKVLEKIIFKHV